MNRKQIINAHGQSLLELLVVISVGILVAGALVFATISSLRNAYFAKSQAQATKLSQEAIEKVRSFRDLGDSAPINGLTISGNKNISSWQDNNMWSTNLSKNDNCSPCYFILGSSSLRHIQPQLNTIEIPYDAEKIPPSNPAFFRWIEISDAEATYQQEKTVTVIVSWIDFSGSHQSKLSTVLRRL